MISDRAKALIKWATDGLGGVSVPDLFHVLRGLGQPIGSALGRQQAALAKAIQTLKAKVEITQEAVKRQALASSLTILSTQPATLIQAQAHYHEAMAAITLNLHPFTLNSPEPQTWSDITTALQAPLQQLRQLGLYWRGHLYDASATEIGTRGLKLEIDPSIIHSLEALENGNPLVGLLLSQNAADPLPKRLLAQVETANIVNDTGRNLVAIELTFPEQMMSRQETKIKQLVRGLS
jgi:biotin operon repressor